MLDDITKDHIIKALKDFDADENLFWSNFPRRSRSDYFISYEGKKYPSKAILRYAHIYVDGDVMEPSGANGGFTGVDSVCRYLVDLNFDIIKE